MIDSGKTTKKDLESTIGRMGHVGFIIPWVFHFLSRLRSLLARARNRRVISIDNTCKKDLVLMISILDKARKGIDMNLLAFRSPDRIYYSDSCPHGLGGYSDQGSAWRFQIPDDLLFRASNNLLEFLAAIITPWIDIINGRLIPGDCALSMTDSTTAEGWMRKSNFILHSLFPNQMPVHFEISPLPKEISSWLTSLLQQLPVSEQLREEHTTAKLAPGDDGQPTASPSDAEIPTWTLSLDTSESSCSAHLQWLSGKEDSREIAMKHWLRAQSEVPSHMWFRPSGRREDKIPRKTKTASLASFYRDNSEPSKTTIPNSNNKRPSPSSCSTNKPSAR